MIERHKDAAVRAINLLFDMCVAYRTALQRIAKGEDDCGLINGSEMMDIAEEALEYSPPSSGGE